MDYEYHNHDAAASVFYSAEGSIHSLVNYPAKYHAFSFLLIGVII